MRRLKDIDVKEYCSRVVDMLYGVMTTIAEFYKIVIIVVGILFLSFPYGYINNFLGFFTLNDLENSLLTGNLILSIAYIFVFAKIIQVLLEGLGTDTKEVKINKISKMVLGTINVIASVSINKTITAEIIIGYFVFFIIIKLILKATKKRIVMSGQCKQN